FVPELLPAAAPEVGFVVLDCEFQRFLIHIGNGQNLASPGILNNSRDEAVGSETRFFDDIVHRMTTPRSRKNDLACSIVTSRKWKMDAASTALAAPSVKPWYRCSRLPAPPEAITGI